MLISSLKSQVEQMKLGGDQFTRESEELIELRHILQQERQNLDDKDKEVSGS